MSIRQLLSPILRRFCVSGVASPRNAPTTAALMTDKETTNQDEENDQEFELAELRQTDKKHSSSVDKQHLGNTGHSIPPLETCFDSNNDTETFSPQESEINIDRIRIRRGSSRTDIFDYRDDEKVNSVMNIAKSQEILTIENGGEQSLARGEKPQIEQATNAVNDRNSVAISRESSCDNSTANSKNSSVIPMEKSGACPSGRCNQISLYS